MCALYRLGCRLLQLHTTSLAADEGRKTIERLQSEVAHLTSQNEVMLMQMKTVFSASCVTATVIQRLEREISEKQRAVAFASSKVSAGAVLPRNSVSSALSLRPINQCCLVDAVAVLRSRRVALHS